MPDYALEGQKWGESSSLGTYGGIVSWAVDSSVPAYAINWISQAFASWAQYGNIRFEQVSSIDQSAIDVSFGTIDGPGNTFGYANYTYSSGLISSADVHFDVDENWHLSGRNVVSSGGTNFYIVALHEIGHAIGLDHYEVTPTVMNAYVSASVTGLTQSDIHGVVAIYGNAPPAPITGTPGNDNLVGGDPDNFIYGFAGSDRLEGGAGNDQLDGGEGADYLDGGANYYFARYDGSTAGVVVRLDYGIGVNGDAQGDQLVNIEGLIGSGNQDFLFGNSDSNALLGQGGNDWLFGIGGDDELHGGGGTDQLLGGAGADRLYGDAGNDQFWFLASEFQAGVWDVIYDFGESASNFDYLRFEGVAASQLIIGDNNGNAVITTTALNYSGGIVILNFSGVQTLDQLIFA